MTPERFEFLFNWTLDASGALWLGIAIGRGWWWGPPLGYMIGRWSGVHFTRWLRRRQHDHLQRMMQELSE